MTATKTNERPGTRAVHRYCGMSASKARQVLDLIRGQDVQRAAEILTGTEREAAEVIGKVLASAVANAAHNDQQNPEELYVSACYADEGATMKRWRPRARGRATRIRKRTCHITIIVSRLPGRRARAAPPAHGGGQRQPLAAGSPPRGAGPTCPVACRAAGPPRPTAEAASGRAGGSRSGRGTRTITDQALAETAEADAEPEVTEAGHGRRRRGRGPTPSRIDGTTKSRPMADADEKSEDE